MTTSTPLLLERFERFFEKTDGCWLWKGGRSRYGYGRFRIRGRNNGAHRVSFEIYKGSSPDKMCVCHTCDVRECVNPDHLFLGSHSENFADMRRKGRNRPPPKTNPCSSRGARNINSRLNETDVLHIKRFLAEGKSPFQIAKVFSISKSTIYDIKKGSCWGWLTPESNHA